MKICSRGKSRASLAGPSSTTSASACPDLATGGTGGTAVSVGAAGLGGPLRRAIAAPIEHAEVGLDVIAPALRF